VSVCLSVGSHISETTSPNVTKFSVLYVSSVAVAQSASDGNAKRFVNDVMFLHNGANGPESKTTRQFRLVRQVAAPGRSLPSPTASCFS